MAVRYADCTRRWHRNREASETRCAQTADASFSDFGTSDVSPSTGTPTATTTANATAKANATATATATVAARSYKQLQLSLRGAASNCNSRCAEQTSKGRGPVRPMANAPGTMTAPGALYRLSGLGRIITSLQRSAKVRRVLPPSAPRGPLPKLEPVPLSRRGAPGFEKLR